MVSLWSRTGLPAPALPAFQGLLSTQRPHRVFCVQNLYLPLGSVRFRAGVPAVWSPSEAPEERLSSGLSILLSCSRFWKNHADAVLTPLPRDLCPRGVLSAPALASPLTARVMRPHLGSLLKCCLSEEPSPASLWEPAQPSLPAPHSPDPVVSFPSCHVTSFIDLFVSWITPLERK